MIRTSKTGSISRTGTMLAAALAACGLLLGGCADEYERTDITNVRKSDLGGAISTSRIEVPVGMIVTAHIVPFNDDREMMAAELRSANPDVVEVAHVVSDRDYAFLGMRPGVTEVELRADGKVVLIIQAVVTEQSPP